MKLHIGLEVKDRPKLLEKVRSYIRGYTRVEDDDPRLELCGDEEFWIEDGMMLIPAGYWPEMLSTIAPQYAGNPLCVELFVVGYATKH